MPGDTPTTALGGRRVMVTGASGFIGDRLCRLCADAGAEVVAVGRTPKPSPDGDGRRHVVADFAEPGRADAVIREVRPGVVFHLAGDSRAARGAEMVGPTFAANLVGPVNLLSAVAAHPGCTRVVLVGSFEEPRGEEAPVVPSSPYAASKFAQTVYAAMFHRLYGTPVTVARVCMVYGPGQRDAKKLIPSVTLGLLRGESPKMSSGARLVDWVHVADVAEGLAALAAADDAAVAGRAFDIGSGTRQSVRSVAERIAAMIPEATGRLQIGALPDRPMEQERTADVATTTAATGWRPRVTLDDGLRQTVSWYREHQSAFE